MNKFLKAFLSLGLILSLFISVGCGSVEPSKGAKEMLKDAITGTMDAKTYSYNLALSGDLTGPEGEVPQNIKFNGTLVGSVDSKDQANPSFSMKIDGSAQMDSDPEAALSAEIRYIGKILYAQLSKLPMPEGQEIPKELEDAFLNKWWSYPLPDEIVNQLGLVGGEEELTEEQKRIREVFKESDFLNPEYQSNVDVDGVNAFEYKINFDRDKFIAFVDKVGQERNEPMSDIEKEDLEASIQKVDLEGSVYVAAEGDPYIVKVDGVLKIHAEEDSVNGDIKFVWTNSSVNEDVVVSVPEGAQPFSPLFLAGLGLLGSQSITDDAMLDDSAAVTDELPQSAVPVKKK